MEFRQESQQGQQAGLQARKGLLAPRGAAGRAECGPESLAWPVGAASVSLLTICNLEEYSEVGQQSGLVWESWPGRGWPPRIAAGRLGRLGHRPPCPPPSLLPASHPTPPQPADATRRPCRRKKNIYDTSSPSHSRGYWTLGGNVEGTTTNFYRGERPGWSGRGAVGGLGSGEKGGDEGPKAAGPRDILISALQFLPRIHSAPPSCRARRSPLSPRCRNPPGS